MRLPRRGYLKLRRAMPHKKKKGRGAYGRKKGGIMRQGVNNTAKENDMKTIIEIENELMESERYWVPKESQGESNNEAEEMVQAHGDFSHNPHNLLITPPFAFFLS